MKALPCQERYWHFIRTHVAIDHRLFVYGGVICRDMAFHKDVQKNGGFAFYNGFLFCRSIS